MQLRSRGVSAELNRPTQRIDRRKLALSFRVHNFAGIRPPSGWILVQASSSAGFVESGFARCNAGLPCSPLFCTMHAFGMFAV